MENKVDKRIIKTRQKLTDGLAEVLKTKNIRSVKVNELTVASGVNRATFYLHYKDIEDFLEQTENELIREFTEIFDCNSLRMQRDGTFPAVHAVFEFISTHATIINAIVGPNGDKNFSYHLASIAREKIIHDLVKRNYENLIDHYSIYYMINGCSGVIFKWINDGMKEPSEQMAKILDQFISKGTRLIQ